MKICINDMYYKVGFLSTQLHKVGTDINIHLGKNEMNQELHSKLLAYLKKGEPIFSFMEISEDMDGNLIGPHQIFTNGVWVWPSYFHYFLQKYPSYEVDELFLDYIKLHDFKIRKLKKEELQKIENFFLSNS